MSQGVPQEVCPLILKITGHAHFEASPRSAPRSVPTNLKLRGTLLGARFVGCFRGHSGKLIVGENGIQKLRGTLRRGTSRGTSLGTSRGTSKLRGTLRGSTSRGTSRGTKKLRGTLHGALHALLHGALQNCSRNGVQMSTNNSIQSRLRFPSGARAQAHTHNLR